MYSIEWLVYIISGVIFTAALFFSGQLGAALISGIVTGLLLVAYLYTNCVKARKNHKFKQWAKKK